MFTIAGGIILAYFLIVHTEETLIVLGWLIAVVIVGAIMLALLAIR